MSNKPRVAKPPQSDNFLDQLYLRYFLIILIGVLLLGYAMWLAPAEMRRSKCQAHLWDLVRDSDFEGFDNNTGVRHSNPPFIVPNVVHFLKVGNGDFSFREMICVLAAFRHQKPEVVYIHTNEIFTTVYWRRIKYVLRDTLQRKFVIAPVEIHGYNIKKSSHVDQHVRDILRIQILQDYGGIFLDSYSYLVKSLDEYRHYEMTVSWPENDFLSTAVIVAHKDARFLELWKASYREYYAHLRDYNAKEKPVREILSSRPELVHRWKKLFGTRNLETELYVMDNWKEWRNQFVINVYSDKIYDFNWNWIVNRKYINPYIAHVPYNPKTNNSYYPKTLGKMVMQAYSLGHKLFLEENPQRYE